MNHHYTENLDETFGVTRECEGDHDSVLVEPTHEHDWVNEKVAVGSGVWNKRDVAALKRAQITHVIDCRSGSSGGGGSAQFATAKLYEGSGIEVHFCPTDDDGRPKSREWFDKGRHWAAMVFSQNPNAAILVHCAAGINRGPSMAYAVLRTMGESPTRAEMLIRQARPIARMIYRVDAERACAADPVSTNE